jgi:hypothetical protein
MRDWESMFGTWAQPPGRGEQQRCDNAERAVRNAIAGSGKLNTRDIRVFLQGSYRNNVNVRQESDVDLGILCRDTFYFDLPDGMSRDQFGLNTPATYDFALFKNEVGAALVDHFGAAAVTRGDKAFDVRANSYRVDADVAPFFEYRWYAGANLRHDGVRLESDTGKVIVNWPEQHYANGVAKNEATGRAFKGVVRILKRLCIEMSGEGIAAAIAACPGFLIECLTYNVPNDRFSYSTWRQVIREVLAFLFNNTLDDARCANWHEVSELKWLFRPTRYGVHTTTTQKWTRQQAHAFVDSAWNYLGLQ